MGTTEFFTVIVIDGEATDLCDIDTPSIRYDGLTWDESVQLARLSFVQGFEIVIWKMGKADE